MGSVESSDWTFMTSGWSRSKMSSSTARRTTSRVRMPRSAARWSATTRRRAGRRLAASRPPPTRRGPRPAHPPTRRHRTPDRPEHVVAPRRERTVRRLEGPREVGSPHRRPVPSDRARRRGLRRSPSGSWADNSRGRRRATPTIPATMSSSTRRSITLDPTLPFAGLSIEPTAKCKDGLSWRGRCCGAHQEAGASRSGASHHATHEIARAGAGSARRSATSAQGRPDSARIAVLPV